MAFKGDASQIPLTNIFQTLQLNLQEGVMAISQGKMRRRVRVLPNGIRLLESTRDSHDVLQSVLVKQKIVTPSQFANVLSTMGESSLFPGEFLIHRRILTNDQVENEVCWQIQELVYEIFSWKKAKYEFTTGDPGNDLEIFDPAGMGQSLVLNTSSILMEAARREDEWERVRSQVPNEHEIYVPIDKTTILKPRTYQSEIAPDAIQEIKKLLDGEHTIQALAEKSTLSTFQCFRVIGLLLGQQEIRPLSIKEKKDLAEDLRRKFKNAEVAEIYQNLLAIDPADMDIRLKLVGILERKKEGSPLLVEQYQALADHQYEARDFVGALNYLKKIIPIERHHLHALERIFDIHYLSKNMKEAVETAKALVDAIKSRKEFERGSEILLKIVDVLPAETFLFHELADFFIYANQPENAVMCLKSVASFYQERGDLTRLRKTYERIASIDPKEASNLRKVVGTERKIQRAGRASGRSRIPSRSLVWVALAVMVLLAAGFFTAMEVLSRQAYAAVQSDVKACVEAGKYDDARKIIEDLIRRYPVSTLPGRLSSDASEFSAREREQKEKHRKDVEKHNLHFGSFLARVESLMIGKRHLEAMELAREQKPESLSEPNRRRLAQIEGELQKYFSASEEIVKRGREMIQAGRYEEGHQLFIQLMMNYPSTPASRGLRLPLLVKSTPPGARVTLNGEALGVTPFTIYYDPLARFSLSFTKDGFRPVSVGEEGSEKRSIDFTKDWMVSVRLDRIPSWVFDAHSPVDCTALVHGGRVYAGTRGGRVFCLGLAKGDERWNYSTPDGWDVASGIRAYKSRIYFGTYDGSFHILDVDTGRPVHRLVPLTPPRPIRHAASEATPNGLAAVSCGGTAVVGVDIVGGMLLWTHRAELEVLGAPELYRNSILAVSIDGIILLLDPATGTPARRIQIGARLQTTGRIDGAAYLLGDVQGRLRRIDLETGQVQWMYESPMANVTSPAIGGDLVFFGSAEGLIVALDLKTGDLKWRGKVADVITAQATWFKGQFHLGTKTGQVISLNAITGSPEWTFGTGGPISAAGGTGDNTVIFSSDDHKLYAFTEN